MPWTVYLPEMGIAIGEDPISTKNKKILTPKRQMKKYQQQIATTWKKPESMV